VIGILGSIICNFAVRAKGRLGYDDALDAFGLHGVGGFIGLIFTGIFRQGFVSELDGGAPEGGAIEANWTLVGYQCAIAFSIAAYSFVVTYVILMAMKLIPGIQFMGNETRSDYEEMGEVAYLYGTGMESVASLGPASMTKTTSQASKRIEPTNEDEVADGLDAL
jgi:Amt family ammonium transporter